MTVPSQSDAYFPDSSPPEQKLDISHRAVSLGRLVDRLADGEYTIRIIKSQSVWRVEVTRYNQVQSLDLRR
jgi:hypothetical protein